MQTFKRVHCLSRKANDRSSFQQIYAKCERAFVLTQKNNSSYILLILTLTLERSYVPLKDDARYF